MSGMTVKQHGDRREVGNGEESEAHGGTCEPDEEPRHRRTDDPGRAHRGRAERNRIDDEVAFDKVRDERLACRQVRGIGRAEDIATTRIAAKNVAWCVATRSASDPALSPSTDCVTSRIRRRGRRSARTPPASERITEGMPSAAATAATAVVLPVCW